MWVNTKEFQQTAEFYRKHGYYIDAVPGTKDYKDFWSQERDRCLNGFSVGGKQITGYHYHYLNYCPIRQPSKKKKERITDFPMFYDWDYNYFWAVEIARYGIDKKKYESLNLDIDIHPDDLKGGKMIPILKARRKGYSYKAGSMLARNYYHMRETKNYAFAEDKKYLLGSDGMLTKCWGFLSFIDANTPFAQPRLNDTGMYKRGGYQEYINNTYVDKGRLNSIEGITLKDNPGGLRGLAGELMFFEEAGSFPSLGSAWQIALPTVIEGDIPLGIMIAFGTGGGNEQDFESLEDLFYNPDANECIRIDNQWDDGASGTYCGFFSPIYLNLQGFIDEDGNSKIEEAKAFEIAERKKRRDAKQTNKLAQYVAERPFSPSEAMLQVSTNEFPTKELHEQYNDVIANKRWSIGTPGDLYHDSKNKIKFEPNYDNKPIYKFPHNKEDDLTGSIVIYEGPYRNNEGVTPSRMYIVCHDPYAHSKSATSSSLGAAYVIKRDNPESPTYSGCIVASYVARPSTLEQYNKNLFLLAEYYNAKIGFENDRGDVIGYARKSKKLNMLEEQFKVLDKRQKKANVQRDYGMHMNEQRKADGEYYIADWLNETISVSGDGTKRKRLHTITDPALLQELIKYKKDGNFDRVMAIMIGMYHLKEYTNVKVSDNRVNKAIEFLKKHY